MKLLCMALQCHCRSGQYGIHPSENKWKILSCEGEYVHPVEVDHGIQVPNLWWRGRDRVRERLCVERMADCQFSQDWIWGFG